VRGPFSSLYGQNALGGVVNVITRSPKKREMEASASYGSYDTKAAHVRYDDVYTFNGGLIESIVLSISGEMKKIRRLPQSARHDDGEKRVRETIPVTGWEQTTDRRGTRSTSW
jgi:outer membrane receptor for ferrienterochelin and colicin